MVSFNYIFLHIHITVLLITIKDGSIMKKTYQKPDIMFDNFTLSTSIAASCKNISESPALYSCGYKSDEGYNVFYSSGWSGCEDASLFPELTGITYDFFVNLRQIFNSL